MAAKKKATSPYLTSTDVDELSPTNRMAHEILVGHGDLLPSIDRIMQAGLPESDTIAALTFFRDSLDAPGDPNRDPKVAIASAAGQGSAT